MAEKRSFDDIDLMHYVDGELDPSSAAALSAYLESDEADEARVKVASLEQMSEVLSSYLELEADAVEARLDAMWEVISERTQADEPMHEAVRAPAREERAQPGERTGLWASIVRFFDGYRGHIVTGVVAAGAAAAIILALRPPDKVVVPGNVAVREVRDTDARTPEGQTPKVTDDAPRAEQRMVNDVPSAPEIEDLDVSNGESTVIRMPSDSDDDVGATIIYLDLKDIEGPL